MQEQGKVCRYFPGLYTYLMPFLTAHFLFQPNEDQTAEREEHLQPRPAADGEVRFQQEIQDAQDEITVRFTKQERFLFDWSCSIATDYPASRFSVWVSLRLPARNL